ncbi:SDR family oxidoreductase [Amycolatopsis minnesotensis]|uniref:Type I polyketide synthase n=1 Tax=Amycolatopsis minnesotensis TaxID=337894 RepID=A0ABP5DN54_9PSEU
MERGNPGQRAAVLGVGPFGTVDPLLAAAVSRGGGFGIVGLTGEDALEALRRVAGAGVPFGARVGADCPFGPAELDGVEGLALVVLAAGATWDIGELEVPVLVEVTDLDEAREAVVHGAYGVIARGSESGGVVSELSSFVLVQRLLDGLADVGEVPVWVCGGIGPRTAAAAVAGGAAGVVLDVQLGLFPDADVPRRLRDRLARADGSESVLVDGRRVLRDDHGIPWGQDAPLAALFAERSETAEDAVRAIVRTVTSRRAVPPPADQGAPLCRSTGAPLPVAQGPMTRVSDQPEFAEAVASHGGLPFVAVALADEERAAKLLTDTAELLGDRPWGAGILGFVPDELREAQLRAIHRTRPRAVLIAGGRPAQAKALEAEGIATYLHVPSPILLRQFLDAGVRRFVFEGAECGGHIGPRTSFSLWESQLDVLAKFVEEGNSADGVEIFFAGGVHDARSAAMVAAMAAPLAERGAGIGVLMGTAYLFTDEAVRHGAITELFQRQAVEADRTATVETAPGHLTRCLHSPFVAEFAEVERNLREEGVPKQERWERLERLNTGRLRIASKGVRRDGDELVAVDADGQLTDGMYMAGQVAVLRGATTDIATLHRAVVEDAARLLSAGEPARAEPAAATVDVAVIGMAGVFPGAPDLSAFWSNVLRGVDSVTEVPPERWDAATYYREDGAPGSTPSKWGGFLPDIPFDPVSFGIPPTSMGSIDPAQLLSLEIARRALADAGAVADRERTGVVFGAEAGGDLHNAGVLRALLPGYLEDLPAELAELLPTFTEDTFPGTLANVISGRVANRLDLGGPNYTVDAACGSSLAALDLACKELAGGGSDLMLCGAVDLHNGVHDYLMFASAGALSPTGRCRPFDRAADGIALGEGVACVVLKRLADAERDGDRIYAVVKGVGAGSDGKAFGLTAPRPEGQRRALERAYRNAGISPSKVGLVEAHGTGTVVGDGTELSTLTEFFAEAGAAPGGCAIGSVKGQIGHTKCAAGLAGLIKAALSLWTGVVPPTAQLRDPHTVWEEGRSPFSFTTRARPWLRPRQDRVAGVSAFGFGGTNFHAVLAAGPSTSDSRHRLRDWDAELFVLRGDDAADRLVELAGSAPAELPLSTVASTVTGTGPVRYAIVASDRAELLDALAEISSGAASGKHWFAADERDPGEVAFLFPGQGSQRTGMLAELFTSFGELRGLLDLDQETASRIFPPRAFDAAATTAQDDALRDTRVAQPALGMAGIAMARVLDRLGVRPGMLGGHSYGELAALSVAGAFDAPTLLRLSERRAAAVMNAVHGDPGAMAAVRTTPAALAEVLGEPMDVVVANHNAPDQVVLSGGTDAIELAVKSLKAHGIGAKRIPVACAFHSPLVAGAADEFDAVLAGERVRDPRLPVWANRTARRYERGAVRAELTGQLGSPVRFAEQIEDMYAEGARTFLEVGPGRVLTGLVSSILGDRPHTAIATDPGAAPGLRGFLTALAKLAVAGVEVDTEWLFRGRVANRAPVARRPEWTVNGQLVRRGRTTPPGGLRPAERIRRSAMAESTRPGEPDSAVLEFLRGNREVVAAQRDVLLAYFGGARQAEPVTPVAVPPVVVPATVVVEAPVEVTAPIQSTVDVSDLLGTVVGVIAERTGYPGEMIDGDLDLEADLSIDSIKRTEIAGMLLAKLGLRERIDDAEQDELSRKRTAGALADWLSEHVGADAANVAAEPDEAEPAATGIAPGRFVLRAAPSPSAPSGELAGRRVLVLHEPEQSALAVRVSAELAARGAHAVVDPRAEADALICLSTLTGTEEPAAPRLFLVLRDLIGAGMDGLVVAAPLDRGPRTAGLRGLLRSVAREHPERPVRLVELDHEAPSAASTLVAELLDRTPVPVARHTGEGRAAFELLAEDLPSVARAGAGPAGPGAAEAAAIGLDRDSVVLLIGGARGITARFAGTLALAAGCRIELAGRTAFTGEPEDPALRGLADAPALRRALADGGEPLSEVERQVRAVLAGREIANTMDGIRRAGGEPRYHRIDVRDGAAVRHLVEEVHARHGRLDGIVHAAGVIDDKLMSEKDGQSFRTVFGTKVDGAVALLDAVTRLPEPPKFVTFFGSIAAVLGNRGQTDYAAANDALDVFGSQWAERTGNRALTVHWGPWAPSAGGMVSEELAREYARRDVKLIDPDEGAACLLAELAYGGPSSTSVVYTASPW